MKRMIKASSDIDLEEEASIIVDQICQAYENYGDEYGDADLYEVADEHINECLDSDDIYVWNKCKDFIQSNYSVSDIYEMSPKQFEGIIRKAFK